MKVQQFIKKLNNTELGKGNTHECYISSPKNTAISDFCSNNLRKISFVNRINGEIVETNITNPNNELRVNQLGSYYRKYNVSAGDEIILERVFDKGDKSYYIGLKINSNIITFQKNKNGFEVLNMDRLSPKLSGGSYNLQAFYKNKLCNISIEFLDSFKKRKNSPFKTDFYDISVNGNSILGDYKGNDFIELENIGPNNILKKVVVWQEYEFNY